MQDDAVNDISGLAPATPTASAADLWREVEAYARATGDIDLDMVIAAIAASEGVPLEDAEQPWAAPPEADL